VRPQDILNAIKPHEYGLKAADACDPIIEQLFKSRDNKSLIASIQFIQEMSDRDDRDTAMEALIHWASTGDREAAEQIIKGHEYFLAHLYLGKQMHALAKQQEMAQQVDFPEIVIDEMPNYPQRADNYEPAFKSELEILFETSMPSHAPDAAITAASISI